MDKYRLQTEPSAELDAISKLQFESHALNQLATHKKLELEALRLTIVKKAKEIRDVEAAKLLSVERTNALIEATEQTVHRLPCLTVETVFQIFRYLHMTAVLNGISPLFEIAEGFADLPGWQHAILHIVPFVLVSAPASWDKGLFIINNCQLPYLGYCPRLRIFGNKDTVDHLASRDPAMLVLADEDTFDSDVVTAKTFNWDSVVLLAATVPQLRYMLQACGEFLWSARSLYIGLGAKYGPTLIRSESRLSTD